MPPLTMQMKTLTRLVLALLRTTRQLTILPGKRQFLQGLISILELSFVTNDHAWCVPGPGSMNRTVFVRLNRV